MPVKRKKKPAPPMAECDRLFAEMIRERGACEECGSTEVLQCAHGFSRRYPRTRCDIRNAFCLCRKHHHYYTMRPLEWDEWLRVRWGENLYDELRHLALWGPKVDWKAERARLRALHAAVFS